MAIVSFSQLALSFGHPPLLESATGQILPGERVALLGRNGAGKTTLMRCLAGQLDPAGGVVSLKSGTTCGFLPQEVPEQMSETVFAVVASGVAELRELLTDYHLAVQQVSRNSDAVNLAALEAVQLKVDEADAWTVQERVGRAISQLGLPADAPFDRLSGGMKRRALLARALVGNPDLLLLDEPTNHLDIESIQWLEDMLLRYEGTLVLVTHDRMLVRRVANRILEIDRGRLTSWACDYDTFLVRKEQALASEEARWDALDRKLAQEEAWVRQGIKARRTRNEGRVRALERMREERAQRRHAVGKARLELHAAQRSGEMVIEAHDLAFGYGENTLVSNFSTRIVRGDRIGVLGRNGSGKTTLLGLLLGSLSPQGGRVLHGTRLEVVYYDQMRCALDGEQTLVEAVSDGREVLMFNGRALNVYAYLERFLFPRYLANMQVTALSGGERNRLVLARLLASPSNVLVMDEPTNDLDVETLELLEQLLIEYKGTLLLVSHDREFLNNVVTSTMALQGDGTILEYAGGYDDWLAQSRPEQLPEQATKERKKRVKPDRPRKRTFKEQIELDGMDSAIQALETEKAQLEAMLAEPEFYRSDGQRIADVRRRTDELVRQIDQAYARWEELEGIQG